VPKPWDLRYTAQARKDAKKLKKSPLAAKAKDILALLARDPFVNPPPFEALVGDLRGAYSRRLNIQHRLVYQVLQKERVVKILRLWTHYE
jgi:Txe/YoeB family toxin of toxin-antitoxin system